MAIISNVNELPSVRKGYIDGVRYYYDLLMKQPTLADHPVISDILVRFGKELRDLEKYPDISSDAVTNMSVIFREFFPDGQLEKNFTALNLETAMSGISECLLSLKKSYHILY